MMRTLVSLALTASIIVSLTPITASAANAGKLEVKFLYVEPGTVDPSYHTAIWLEDQDGKLVKTLFVSNELSTTQYKSGKVCPDWVQQAGWEKAPKSQVDAVTGPTPEVGAGTLTLDLAKLDVPEGKYRFRFQVHIAEEYNVLFQGQLTVGKSEQEVKIETLYRPSKPDIGTDVVRDVQVHYYPAEQR